MPILKSLNFPLRVIQLIIFIKKKKIDIAFGQSSFYLPVTSFFLAVPSLYTNDNEHALGNIIGFLFAKKIVLPLPLKEFKLTRLTLFKKKTSFYPGIKEAIYLSQDVSLQCENNLTERAIYFRPEPNTAQYYKGPKDFFDTTLLNLSKDFKVMVLPRNSNQILHYQSLQSKSIKVVEKPIPLNQIARDCILFIGAGGSMTRELAVLGIPTVSIYQEKLLKVDEYLINKKLLIANPEITIDEIHLIIKNRLNTPKNLINIEDGNKSFNIMMQYIINLKNGQN